MTSEQQKNEIKYQASIAPFVSMLKSGIITAEEYRNIDTILTQKYRPIFVRYISLK